jgi:hypothetical protein
VVALAPRFVGIELLRLGAEVATEDRRVLGAVVVMAPGVRPVDTVVVTECV